MSYRLIFPREPDIPPYLADMRGAPIYYNGYLIGSDQDPHWKPYPKYEFPTIINYLVNNSPSNQHSRTGSMIVASSISGVILSLLIVSLLQSTLSDQAMQSYGWRMS